MIIARAPLRIGIAGGGTDLPSYYHRYGGRCLTLGIDLYVTVAVLPEQPWLEPATDPFVARALEALGQPPKRVEVLSDALPGCGLGTSGSLLVALTSACALTTDPDYCAESAFAAETRGMGLCVGKQDQYAAAYGGLSILDIDRDGDVRVVPQNADLASELARHLLLVYAGGRHSASDVLRGQAQKTQDGDEATLEGLRHAADSVVYARDCAARGEWNMIGRVFTEQWKRKRATSPLATSEELDAKVGAVIAAGAYGAKVCGAGGGGFIVACCEDVAKVQDRLDASGMPTRRVAPSNGGVRHVVNW